MAHPFPYRPCPFILLCHNQLPNAIQLKPTKAHQEEPQEVWDGEPEEPPHQEQLQDQGLIFR